MVLSDSIIDSESREEPSTALWHSLDSSIGTVRAGAGWETFLGELVSWGLSEGRLESAAQPAF